MSSAGFRAGKVALDLSLSFCFSPGFKAEEPSHVCLVGWFHVIFSTKDEGEVQVNQRTPSMKYKYMQPGMLLQEVSRTVSH